MAVRGAGRQRRHPAERRSRRKPWLAVPWVADMWSWASSRSPSRSPRAAADREVCAGQATVADDDAARATTTTVPDYISYIATVKPSVTSIGVFPSPDAPQPSQQFPNPWLYEAGNPATAVPQVFLVESPAPRRLGGGAPPRAPERQHRLGARERRHAHAQSVPHRRVAQRPHDHRHQRHATSSTPARSRWVHPTPRPRPGNFYLYVLLQAPDPTGPYGPYAYGLSSHSDALATFAGGDAEIGIHGNNDASALGQTCRTGASAWTTPPSPTWRSKLPLGTPVDVNA